MKKQWMVLGIVLLAVMAVGMLAPLTQAEVLAQSATRTPTRTPTPTPTRMPTVDLISKLKKQLAFSPGGGLNKIGPWDCLTDEDTSETPMTIRFYGRAWYDAQEGILCLINIPVDQPFDFELTSPSGEKYSQSIDPNSFDDSYTDFDYTADEDGRTAGMIRLWLSPEVEDGNWQIEYQSQFDYIIVEESLGWPSEIFGLFSPRKDANPLELPNEAFELGAENPYRKYSLKPGGSIALAGANLPARRAIPLGLYQIADFEALRLVKAILVETNGNGEFRTNFKIDKTLPPGTYYLGAIVDQKAGNVYDSGPGLGVFINACPGAMDSRLLVGDKVKIDPLFAEENTLFNQPGLGKRKTGQLGGSQIGTILDGPTCADERVWWKVRTTKGVEGWIAEAFDFNQFVVRVP